ncbi:cbb3-type cytochrome oxidase subunit 3 [Vibrio genomosp. F10]|uniref:Cytochrome-c oxidase n=2 Tax=Vibrio genomosp. F10 TaxID=723171 RepID=A0A1B9QV49_9VIBR|nr:CcoQ/FixQ family Cbb3-type cytochrome c oxidase assembly chaperone [Vibrio genomosp. F10]OCH72722.1 cytochrome-c oxidase [Vibrio genomosp. F10]OEE34600.1 cytochrome-c oxidase [Vibrio genomosp. F10 str. ZF-129]OEE94772.1 cytochrome-c oxidase [Vibrio genomosp. F10 str. 9ZD137]OEE96419.1 cytochrome-c oxidase [Vibrio genomosp. F10 str. 9ZC157]OEF05174.1 cytochrome-c oxidase [Vibrio genomosp. F10 str. 9ZB36]
MDIGTIHSIWTVVLFSSFIGIVWWAYGKNRKARFDEDANLVFADEQNTEPKEQGVTKQ